MAIVIEALVTVARAEFPERRIPRRAFAFAGLRTRRNQPTLRHFLEEPVFDQALPVEAAQSARLDHTAPALLKRSQGGERLGEFFMRRRHLRPSVLLQAFRVVHLQAYHVGHLQANHVVLRQAFSAKYLITRRLPRAERR